MLSLIGGFSAVLQVDLFGPPHGNQTDVNPRSGRSLSHFLRTFLYRLFSPLPPQQPVSAGSDQAHLSPAVDPAHHPSETPRGTYKKQADQPAGRTYYSLKTNVTQIKEEVITFCIDLEDIQVFGNSPIGRKRHGGKNYEHV